MILRHKNCYEEKVCYCGKKFYVPKKPRRGRGGKIGLRPMRSRTCSRECSRNIKNNKGVKNNGRKI